MELIPIKERLDDNQEFMDNPWCEQFLSMTIEFFKKAGYVSPWIGYYARHNENLVGSAGFKGPPVMGTVEIAYGIFEPYRQKGLGGEICKRLVDLALKTNPDIRITARTLPEKNFSTRILEKNGFKFKAMVNDPEDGDVWEWEYRMDQS